MVKPAKDFPAELRYLLPFAERHGSEAPIANFDRRLGRHVEYGETLSAKEINSLRELYNQIKAEGHASVINQWLQNAPDNEAAWPISGLLILFAQLGKRGIAPFNDGIVRREEKPDPLLDWSKLPPELAWLVSPAERYGQYQFHNRISNFLESATPADIADLRSL